jgi:hypothetical protein
LKLDHAAGQPGNGAPEVGVFHVGVRIAKAEGGQIQFVERVEEIGAKFEVDPTVWTKFRQSLDGVAG